MLDADFRQILTRSYRNGGEDNSKTQYLEFGTGLLGSEFDGIRFVRGGWVNPQNMLPRGEVVKVGYRVTDNKLQRLRWSYPDDSLSALPAEMTLMEEVTNFRVEVMGRTSSRWVSSWADKIMPRAVRLTFEVKKYGEIKRIYLLPASSTTVSSLEAISS